MPTIAEAGPQSRFYHSRGLRLHYLDWGNPDAPTLILVHGGLEHARVLDQRGASSYPSIAAAVQRLMEHDPLLGRGLAEYVCTHGMRQTDDGQWRWKYDHLIRATGAAEVAPVEPSDLWQAIECPVLLMYGAESWASNPQKDGRLEHFAQARVVVVEQAGHNLHHHQPELFMEHLRAFLG